MAILWFLWVNGYVTAFALGFVVAMSITIALNTRQIRRNSETIRRAAERRLNQSINSPS